jgi:hypothetical protein
VVAAPPQALSKSATATAADSRVKSFERNIFFFSLNKKRFGF